MKKFLGTALILTFIFSACSTKNTESQTSEISETHSQVVDLSPKEFSEKSPNGIILDVRTPQEVAQGKIAGSIAMDFYQPDFMSKATELPKDQEIYIYCAVGARSHDAAQQLLQQGYTKVYHLQGGIQAWYQNGFPIE